MESNWRFSAACSAIIALVKAGIGREVPRYIEALRAVQLALDNDVKPRFCIEVGKYFLEVQIFFEKMKWSRDFFDYPDDIKAFIDVIESLIAIISYDIEDILNMFLLSDGKEISEMNSLHRLFWC